MAKLKVVVTILLLTVFVSACGIGGVSRVVPLTPPQMDEIYIGRNKVPGEVAKWAEDNKIQAKVRKKSIAPWTLISFHWEKSQPQVMKLKLTRPGLMRAYAG